MTDRSIRIVMSASVQGLVNGFKTAQTSAKNLNRTLVENEQSARELTTGLGLIGAAAVAGAGYAIKTFATFDKQMSNVKATGAATATELTRLREAAVQAGASTAFSATEAAAGIENLLKAGVAANDVLGGGLAGALDLAAAGEIEVGQAAEIAATAMTQFNLSGRDVTHVADLLAAGAGKAAGDVTQISQALNQAGLVASQTGLSIEETTGTLAAFASAGLLGSDAGTSFKTMLQRLSAPTKENAAYMAELGISAYDAQGNFVGMSALAGQLTDALGKMTPAQRNAALATIFGADAVRAASVVYDQGAKGIQGWIKAVDDQGYAAQTAAARLDNLQGDLEAFGGAVETALIKAGSGGNDAMRGLVQGATDLVNAFGRIDGSVLSGLTGLVGGAGVLALSVAGLGKLVIGVNNAKAAMQTLGITARTAGIAVTGVGAALGVAAAGLTIWATNAAEAEALTESFMDTLDETGKRTQETSDLITKSLTSGTDSWVDGQKTYIDLAKKMGIASEDVVGAILGQGDATDRVNAAMDRYNAGSSVWERITTARATQVGELRRGITSLGEGLTEAERRTLQASQTDAAAADAQGDLANATTDATGAISDQTAEIEKQVQEQQKAIDAILGMRDAHRGLESAIDDARKSLKDNGKTLDINTEKGRQNQAALDGIAESGLKYVQSLRDQNESQGKVNDALGRTRKQFIDTATDMGMPIEKARELANSLGLIKDKNITVDADTAPARKKSESAADYIDRLKGTITADGDTAPARKKGESAKDYIDRLKSTIGVQADTQPAKAEVDRFISKARSTVIKIASEFSGGLFGGPSGDGEGAGWPGATPRGVSAMSKAVKSIDPGARITSGYRPGAVTATGYPSYHGMGRAIDIVSPNMGATWDKLRRAFPMAKELFYTPRGFLRNGVMGGAAPVTRRTHYSHVHLALAKGGGVRGKGTGTSDEIPAWLSNGEHVLTASDVRKLGGQQAVYRLREAVQAGRLNLDPEPAFANGGAIGSADSAVKRAERELSRARAARRAAKKEKTKAAAEKRVEQAEERLSKARERRANLGGERTEFGRGIRRGDFMESATSGAAGAYGLVDDMLGLSRSGNLTKSQGNRLAKQASRAESAMRGLYKEVDKVDKRLESAAARVEKLQGISDGVRNTLKGEQALGNSIKEGQEGAFRDATRTNSRGETWTEQVWDPGTKASVTAKGLVSDAKSKASTLKAFASKLNQLRAKGLRGTVLQEVAELGSEEGMLVADALLKDTKQISELNKAYGDISKYSGAAGEYVTDAFSKGGLSAAKSFEDGLERQKGSLEKRIYNWGVYMANGLSAALTGKKTGLKKRARGGPVSAGTTYLVGEEGPELIVPQSSGHVMTAQQTRYLASTANAVRTAAPAAAGAPQVTFDIGHITATDANAAVDRLLVKTQDAINTYGINALAQGVGV